MPNKYEGGPSPEEMGIEPQQEKGKVELPEDLEKQREHAQEMKFAQEMASDEEEMRDGFLTRVGKDRRVRGLIKVLSGLMIASALVAGGCEKFKWPEKETKAKISEQYRGTADNYHVLVDSLKGDPQEVYNDLLDAEIQATEALERAGTPADSTQAQADLDSLGTWKNKVAFEFAEKVITQEEKEATERLEAERMEAERKEATEKREAAEKREARERENLRKQEFENLDEEIKALSYFGVDTKEAAMVILKRARKMEELARSSEDYRRIAIAYIKASGIPETREFARWQVFNAGEKAYKHAKTYEDYLELSDGSLVKPEMASRAAKKALSLARTTKEVLDINFFRHLPGEIPDQNEKAASLVKDFDDAMLLATRSGREEDFARAISLAKTVEECTQLGFEAPGYRMSKIVREAFEKGLSLAKSVDDIDCLLGWDPYRFPTEQAKVPADIRRQAEEKAKELANDSYERAKKTGNIKDLYQARKDLQRDPERRKEIERFISIQEELEKK